MQKVYSKVCIRVENNIRRGKERCRNKLKKYDRVNDIVDGVVNQAMLLKWGGTIWGIVADRRRRELYDF